MKNYLNWPDNVFNENITTSILEKPIEIRNEKVTPDSPPILSSIISEKEKKLLELKEKIDKTAIISFKKLTKNMVFSDGDCTADLMFVGEAPGETEDEMGVPFVGKSGSLLRHFLKEAKITKFYITNVVNWRPPENRTPTFEEIKQFKIFLKEHIEIIKPKIIISVGSTALKAFEIQESITKAQSNFFTNSFGLIYSIYHPSYALRIVSKKEDMWKSILLLKQHCIENGIIIA